MKLGDIIRNFIEKLLNLEVKGNVELVTKTVDDESKKEIAKKDTIIIGENATINENDKYEYKCKVHEKLTQKEITSGIVEVTINDKVKLKANYVNGAFRVNGSWQIGANKIHATYKANNTYNQSSIENILTVRKKSISNASANTPDKDGNYCLSRCLLGAEGKQGTNYFCAPFSVMEAIYELYNIDMSQRWLANKMGTTTNGTSHSGIEQGIKAFNKEYNKNCKYEWKNFSQIGWKKMAEYVKDPQIAIIFHIMWHNDNNWNDTGGHYAVLRCVNPKKSTCVEIYSLSGAQLKTRTFKYWETCMNEISQPSVLILRK